MNENAMNNTSKTNWERVDALTEEEIETNDIPPLSEEFFNNSRWRSPVAPLSIVVQVDPDTLAWFQAQGEDYGKRMAAALRIYAQAHKE